MPNEAQLKYWFDQLGYNPTPEQWAVHLDTHRIREVAGGERSGKSYSSALDMFARMPESTLLWLVAADYERTRPEYNYLIEAHEKAKIRYNATKGIDPGEITNELGIRIATKSAKDPRRLAAEAPDGILACEASQLDYETFLRLVGRTAEKRGWLLMSGTFESSLGWYVDLYNLGQTENDLGLKSFSIPTWTNKVIFPGGRSDPEILRLESQFSKDWFQERFGGIPCPPKGLVFTDFRTNIHVGMDKRFQFDPTKPCYLWIDPGTASPYAVLVAQKIDSETVVIVDEIYEVGLVSEEVITVCRKRPWYNKIVGGAIDIAGKQRHGTSSATETWVKKSGITLRAQKIRIQDGTERIKTSLKVNPITNRPGIYINAQCKGLISEFGGCQSPVNGATAVYQWKMDRDGNIIGDVPEDKHNHAIKALSYGLVDLFGYAQGVRAKTKIFRAERTTRR